MPTKTAQAFGTDFYGSQIALSGEPHQSDPRSIRPPANNKLRPIGLRKIGLCTFAAAAACFAEIGIAPQSAYSAYEDSAYQGCAEQPEGVKLFNIRNNPNRGRNYWYLKGTTAVYAAPDMAPARRSPELVWESHDMKRVLTNHQLRALGSVVYPGHTYEDILNRGFTRYRENRSGKWLEIKPDGTVGLSTSSFGASCDDYQALKMSIFSVDLPPGGSTISRAGFPQYSIVFPLVCSLHNNRGCGLYFIDRGPRPGEDPGPLTLQRRRDQSDTNLDRYNFEFIAIEKSELLKPYRIQEYKPDPAPAPTPAAVQCPKLKPVLRVKTNNEGGTNELFGSIEIYKDSQLVGSWSTDQNHTRGVYENRWNEFPLTWTSITVPSLSRIKMKVRLYEKDNLADDLLVDTRGRDIFEMYGPKLYLSGYKKCPPETGTPRGVTPWERGATVTINDANGETSVELHFSEIYP